MNITWDIGGIYIYILYAGSTRDISGMLGLKEDKDKQAIQNETIMLHGVGTIILHCQYTSSFVIIIGQKTSTFERVVDF